MAPIIADIPSSTIQYIQSVYRYTSRCSPPPQYNAAVQDDSRYTQLPSQTIQWVCHAQNKSSFTANMPSCLSQYNARTILLSQSVNFIYNFQCISQLYNWLCCCGFCKFDRLYYKLIKVNQIYDSSRSIVAFPYSLPRP